MKIHVVNPNTTASMTRAIAEVARATARPGTEIVASNPARGPASIQGYYDVAACLPGLMAEAARYPDIDALVVACFDDTGVDALRAMLDVPVIGIGEAAYHAASLISARFSVVTTLPRSVPGLEANLTRYGLMARCVSVRASDVPVLEVEGGGRDAERLITGQVKRAIDEDMADCIILGCAGMSELRSRLSRRFDLPVIDGIGCAVGFMETLVSTGLRTSKAGAYAAPFVAERV
ncbi:MAG: aspartate/glutamate racemase family protein [Roseovarius sp.]|uniref:aspartate/glutamate racemase family protein n=1 Tax=Roseovarius sp. TaxID=1486281 RepID=UPI0032EF4473